MIESEMFPNCSFQGVNCIYVNLIFGFLFRYIITARDCLRLILTHFGSVITNAIQAPAGSFGVDLSREERHRKAVKCHASLVRIRTSLEKKKSVPGNIGTIFKEISTLMSNTLPLK